MRTWASRSLVVVAALASVATSQKKWVLEGKPPAGMPLESDARGSAGVLVTIEASAPPEVTCELAGQGRELMPEPSTTPNTSTYLCPPGGKLSRVWLSGPVKGGGCGGGDDNKAPKSEYLRVVKTELVPTWVATAETSFEMSSEEDVRVEVTSPRTAFVETEALSNATRVPSTVSLSIHNSFWLSVEGGSGVNRRYATIDVRAKVWGVCAAAGCAKPEGEDLKIERKP